MRARVALAQTQPLIGALIESTHRSALEYRAKLPERLLLSRFVPMVFLPTDPKPDERGGARIGRTELIENISRVDLLVTDSERAMKIAADLTIPLVAVLFDHASADSSADYIERSIIIGAQSDKTFEGRPLGRALDRNIDPILFSGAAPLSISFIDNLRHLRPTRERESDPTETLDILLRPALLEAARKWNRPDLIGDLKIDRRLEEIDQNLREIPSKPLRVALERALEGATELIELARARSLLTEKIALARDQKDLISVGARARQTDFAIEQLGKIYPTARSLSLFYALRVKLFSSDLASGARRSYAVYFIESSRWLLESARSVGAVCARALKRASALHSRSRRSGSISNLN